jgi:putative membrane protein
MKNFFSLFAVALLTFAGAASAQVGMMGLSSSSFDKATIQSQQQEEQEGKNFLDDLSNKKIDCSQLKDTDFEKIGEYFMGQSIGDISRHIAMNERMKSMMGEQGEEQVHIAWGKRGSNCDTSASYPQGFDFMPMMGGLSSPTDFNQNNNNSMMWGFGNNSFGGGTGFFGGIFMLIFWILVIAGIVVLVRWIMMSQSHGTHGQTKTSLDILKERYAKGEIVKEDFERIKKDLQ